LAKLVIIGLSSAGFAALLSARKFDPKSEITVIDEKPFDLLHPCGLPYALEGKMPFEDLKHDIGTKKMRIKKITGKATKIDTQKKIIIVNDKDEGGYDSLIIATGSSPVIPPIEGAKELLGKTVFTVHSFNDTKELDKIASKGKTAVIIGAGAIGLEVGFALKERGLEVKIIEALPQILPRCLDNDMVGVVEKHLNEKGILTLTGKKVEKIQEDSIIVEGGKIECDVVVLCVGIKPNVELAKEAGIQLGEKGIKVNEFLETSTKNIFAAGDVTEVPNTINKKAVSIGLANSAYLQGLVAGQNALGKKSKYMGTSMTFVTVLGDLEVASTGFNKAFAELNKINVLDGRAKGKNKYDWFPGAKELIVKVLVDKKTRKVIGCQAIGKDAYMRINVVSTAINAGMTIDDLFQVELAYCPPISEARDLLFLACDLAKRKMEKS